MEDPQAVDSIMEDQGGRVAVLHVLRPVARPSKLPPGLEMREVILLAVSTQQQAAAAAAALVEPVLMPPVATTREPPVALEERIRFLDRVLLMQLEVPGVLVVVLLRVQLVQRTGVMAAAAAMVM